ncbi:helix-turn-helix transcriptional regulator [Dactylosporangium sp. NPDC000555]|uniref:helix-turn-helix domain-containing protein n=1 Tax=Dactylosporangium sp. NPDC000555 TaxID=3154260 RepID=UPI003333A19D
MAVGGEDDGRVALFGIPQLDQLLQGLFWGENVFWALDGDDAGMARFAEGVLRCIARAPSFARRIVVDTQPRRWTAPDGFEYYPAGMGLHDLVADLKSATDRPGGPGVVLAINLRALARDDRAAARATAQLGHFALQHGVVTHWFDAASDQNSGVQTLAQCVIEARAGHLRIERADGRRSQVRGAMLPYRLGEEGLTVEATSAASLLGRGLRSIRHQRGWTQAHLAELVGVSASAISQAERGQHALSLETVLELSDKLGMSVDHLLRGRPPSYELARADGRVGGAPYLIDSESLGLRTTVVRIPPRGAAAPAFRADKAQVLLVAVGLVQVVLPAARPILRQGDALTVHQAGVSSCRNLGDDEAIVFWQEHD